MKQPTIHPNNRPKYPIYVPSKGRATNCYTAKMLLNDGAVFHLVVEPQEYEKYKAEFPSVEILQLPWNDHKDKHGNPDGLIASRNWIKQHSIDGGHGRHWQLDDNMTQCLRNNRGKRIPANCNPLMRAMEDFVDRYTNVAIAGPNYDFFAPKGVPPFYLNNHVYSFSLINNNIPHRWRLRYNDDTDLCLQVLSDGWCTVLFNAFLVHKLRTGTVKGGNTDNLYQDDGRTVMSRELERMWPYIVNTTRRFKRAQHSIRNAWKDFKTPLERRTDIDWENLDANEYGMQLNQVAEIKNPELKKWYEQNKDLSDA